MFCQNLFNVVISLFNYTTMHLFCVSLFAMELSSPIHSDDTYIISRHIKDAHIDCSSAFILFSIEIYFCYDASGAFDSSGGDNVISNTILHGARLHSDVSSSNFVGTT